MSGPARLMLVDDDGIIRSMCAEALQLRGYTVDTAVNGREALQMLTTTAYAAVVSDIEMPMLDGINLYLTITKTHAYLKNRFVFITGNTSKDMVHRLGLMKRPHVFKPFKLSDLVSAVEAVVMEASGDVPISLDEKRAYVRSRLVTDCSVFEDSRHGQRFFTGKTVDISAGGVGIEFHGSALIPHISVRIAFVLKNLHINRKARVVWSRIIKDRTLAGLAFNEVVPLSVMMPRGFCA